MGQEKILAQFLFYIGEIKILKVIAMDVEKVLRSGYFDKLKIDGSIKPIINSDGTLLSSTGSFKDALNASTDSFKHAVANLKITLYGEASTDISVSELDRIRKDRQIAGVPAICSNDSADRGIVAYADVLILKGGYTLPFGIIANGRSEKDLVKLANTEDMLELLVAATKLSEYIKDKSSYSEDWINIAIINKVYVFPIFRRCGISKWLHCNISDIINMYSLVFPLGIVQMYGDFSGECKRLFNMDNNTYNKMLYAHYKSLGYNKLHKLKIKNAPSSELILYKLLI